MGSEDFGDLETMSKRSGCIIALFSMALTAMGLLYLAGQIWPRDVSKCGPWDENVGRDSNGKN